MILAAPDYLPISFANLLSNFLYLFTSIKISLIDTSGLNKDIDIKYKSLKLFGYSCRSLFHTFMEYFKKDDLVIVTTPLHHTSFRNIIQLFVKPENIHIIDMNENYNEIKKLPDVEKCDLVIVTHLFGLDLKLRKLEEFKEKHNCLFVEDRVQGGSIDKDFSNDIFDVAFYSCGMDKRPVALGGAYINFRNTYLSNQILNFMKSKINSYEKERDVDRFLFLIKKIPTYLFYNNRVFIYVFMKLLNLCNYSLTKFVQLYREKNPGFSHDKYLKMPSNALLMSIYCNKYNYKEIESLYSRKCIKFMWYNNDDVKKTYFPWYTDVCLLTPYNTVSINENKINDFVSYLDKLNICVVKNPTYKVFDHEYANKEKDIKFNNSLVYIPSLGGMTDDEILYLSKTLGEFIQY
tara:strand:- start:20 stop:1234 length:1215 start_codon:yes stop_codon:yes gene_type:complete